MSAKFDRQDVIQKATALFWEKGFHAASMRDLQAAIDLRPGSIYAAFGSKEGLFKEALQHYTDLSLEMIAAHRAASPSPLAALQSILRSAVTDLSSRPNGMCMLVKSIAELTEANADLLAEAKRLLAVVEDAFTDLLTEAVECGELSKSNTPKRLARIAQMQMFGLRTYAQAHGGDVNAAELVEDAMNCLR